MYTKMCRCGSWRCWIIRHSTSNLCLVPQIDGGISVCYYCAVIYVSREHECAVYMVVLKAVKQRHQIRSAGTARETTRVDRELDRNYFPRQSGSAASAQQTTRLCTASPARDSVGQPVREHRVISRDTSMYDMPGSTPPLQSFTGQTGSLHTSHSG